MGGIYDKDSAKKVCVHFKESVLFANEITKIIVENAA